MDSLFAVVPERLQRVLPWVFAVVLALSRWPGLFPPNFSVAYALCLCSGIFLRGRIGWAMPLTTLVVSDILLNFWYQFGKGFDVWTSGAMLFQAGNYVGYAVLFGLGRGLSPISRWHWARRLLPVLASSVFGAVLFYVVTNTLAWLLNPFRNPEYVKTLLGWWTALTVGTGGWPETWNFLLRGILSSALFSTLFAASWQNAPAESPVEKGEEAPEPEAAPEGEEAKA